MEGVEWGDGGDGRDGRGGMVGMRDGCVVSVWQMRRVVACMMFFGKEGGEICARLL